VLGVDPGLAATGYGLLASAAVGPAVLDTGVVATEPALSLDARVALIYEVIDRLLEKHAPTALALEDLYAAPRYPRTALLMAHARGVVCLAARRRDVTVLTLAPAEVKRAVAAHGAAAKAQVQRGVKQLLGLEATPRPSHVADALALALTAFSRLGGRVR
jgi:crossover junction endodeoxyribonuclease RuvC